MKDGAPDGEGHHPGNHRRDGPEAGHPLTIELDDSVELEDSVGAAPRYES